MLQVLSSVFIQTQSGISKHHMKKNSEIQYGIQTPGVLWQGKK